MGTLAVARRTKVFGRLRNLEVEVDGRTALILRFDATDSLELPPGEHTLVAKMDWASSIPLPVPVRDGATTRVEITVKSVADATWRTFVSPSTVFQARVVA